MVEDLEKDAVQRSKLLGGQCCIPAGGLDDGKDSQQAKKVLEEIKKLLSQSEISSHLSVRMEERGIIVTVLADKYTFDSGSADLKPGLKPILDRVSVIIKGEPNSIRVEGHTDDLPINNDRFPSNWQLSAVRAANVLCYFVANDGVSPDRINCVGYADRRPIAPNSSDAARAENRRVEIVILNDSSPAGSTASSSSRQSGSPRTLSLGAGIAPSFQAPGASS